MFGKKTAKALDQTALALYRVGQKVGGEKGGRVADNVSLRILGPARFRCNTPCTCPACTCPNNDR